MIDVHCHLNFHSFEKDADLVIKNAFDAGVEKIINVGTKMDSSQKALDLADKYKNLYAIIGVHPHHADKLEGDWLDQLEKLAEHKNVVGIGEIGLDYYSYKSNDVVDPKLQEEVFIKQIELSIKLKLPLQIHNRLAGKNIIKILKTYKSNLLNIPGMFHCMSGDIPLLKDVLNLGFFVGFDGNITYDGIARGETTALTELVKYAPIDRIVTETDSPFLSPKPYRGSRNIPSYVIIIGNFIAKTKQIDSLEVDQKTSENAQLIFKLSQ